MQDDFIISENAQMFLIIYNNYYFWYPSYENEKPLDFGKVIEIKDEP